jgi:hypothetical protein
MVFLSWHIGSDLLVPSILSKKKMELLCLVCLNCSIYSCTELFLKIANSIADNWGFDWFGTSFQIFNEILNIYFLSFLMAFSCYFCCRWASSHLIFLFFICKLSLVMLIFGPRPNFFSSGNIVPLKYV